MFTTASSRLLLSFALTMAARSGMAQSAWVPGEVLVLLEEGAEARAVQRALLKTFPPAAGFQEMKMIGKASRYHRLSFSSSVMRDAELEKLVARIPGVENTSLNHFLNYRAQPNDALYGSQWNMQDINVESVWDITTGGTMANGMEIAVGIVDTEVDQGHEDLQDNIWPGSPGGGADFHGTAVASVVGAVGNNNIGISGVSQHVRIVALAQTNTLADVTDQFLDALAIRTQFNNSNGVNGALIVALTASWGTPGSGECGFTFDLFEDLGNAGILVVTAGPNSPVDIDVNPEFPSSCDNPNNIVVTSYGPLGQVPFAIGQNTVHLLAPGVDIPVADENNGYTVADGNSFAIPHVAGAIAMLYAVDCPSLASMAFTHPQQAAMLVKDALLQNVTPVPGADALTITGGKLNVAAAFNQLLTGCVPCDNYTIDFNTSEGNNMFTAIFEGEVLLASDFDDELTTCLPSGCYTIGAFDPEGNPIGGSYTVTDGNGQVVVSGTTDGEAVALPVGPTLAGCTDPSAINYDPAATCDDGTCCASGITLSLLDAGGDGWEGATYTIANTFGDTVITGTLAIGSSGAVVFCDLAGCYTIMVSSGTDPGEISWSLDFPGGPSGGANASTPFTLGMVIDGCTDPDANNYAPSANCEDGTCCFGTSGSVVISAMSAPGADWVLSDTSGIMVLSGNGAQEHACLQPQCAYVFTLNDPQTDGMVAQITVTDGVTGQVTTITTADGSSQQQTLSLSASSGCTDPDASNYNPGAICDDGTCCFQTLASIIVQPDDPGSTGSFHYSVTNAGNLYEGDAVIAFDENFGITYGEVQLCLADGCLGIVITEIGTDLSPDGFLSFSEGILDPSPIQFDIQQPFFTSVNTGTEPESCDGLDNDCDGSIDEDFTWYTDADGDEYGGDASAVILCDGPLEPGLVQQGGDCNDADPLISPAQNEQCGDGVDNNCDGIIDGLTTDFQGGCNNPMACNYDPAAFCDDGSCVLDTQPLGTEVYSPDWTLEDFNGNTVELYALLDQGHTVILDLFTTWCPPSQQMVSSGFLSDWNEHLGPNGHDHIRMVSIEIEDTATIVSLGDFLANSDWPIITRGGQALSQVYASLGMFNNSIPTILMICPDRSITHLYPGPDQLPANNFFYDPEEGLELLNEMCGCHSAPCTGPVGCTDPNSCNHDPAAICSDGTCLPGNIWYADVDNDGFGNAYASVIACTQPTGHVAILGDCNPANPAVNPGAAEVCDGLDNDCDGEVDEGFDPVIACPVDVLVTSTLPDCIAVVGFDSPVLSCGNGQVIQVGGPQSGTLFQQGSTTVTFGAFSELPTNALFTEDFADNNAGWTLGTEWQIGAAAASTACECGSAPANDPAEDHSSTSDNGIAGMGIGTCVDNGIHDFRYLTGPAVDVSAVPGPLVLEFWRHLHADYQPFMDHVVEVFNGSEWVLVWANDVSDCTNDADWTLFQLDVTNWKNADLQVRFGQSVNEPDAFITGGWSLDDVRFLGDLVPGSICSFNVIVGPATWYADTDGDGFGDATNTLVQCEQPTGYLDNADDCDDSNADIFPDAMEACDGFDNNCDGQVDESDADNDGDGSTVCGGDCNDNDSGVHPGAPEICDGVDNDCNGSVDDGLPVTFTCPADTTVQTVPFACSGAVDYAPPIFTDCAGGSFTLLTGLASGAAFPLGTTAVTYGGLPTGAAGPVLLNEDFSDISGGWTLDPEWQIGPAQPSFCSSSCGADPASDHTTTSDNGVAGMIIGGCASTALHTFRYLTSPPMDAQAATILTLEFWRHAHGDYAPYMQHHVQVFNGSVWVTIWEHTVQSCLNDADWTFQSFDVTAHKNAGFRVRFGKSVGAAGAFNTGGWSVDDVRVITDGSFDNTCSFEVTVLATDTTATYPCGASITLQVDEGTCTASSANLPLPGIFTDCVLDDLFNDAPADLPLGASSVHWIAVHSDLSTDTCTLEVLVVDEEDPVITCGPAVTLTADAGTCSATNVVLSPPITSDNCSVASVTNDHPSTTFNAGTTELTWTAIDGSGNTSTCVQLVMVEGDSGLPPVVTCPPDTTLTIDPILCAALLDYPTPVLVDNCIATPLHLTTGLPSGSPFPPGTTIVEHLLDGNYFSEDFSDNSAGWGLGTEWQIGPAMQGACGNTCPGNDPANDHTLTTDNGVAGMIIGGCVSTALHAFAFIESPPIDASSAVSLTLEFWRHLHTDYAPYMRNRVDVFNGNAWVTIWEHLPQVCLNDADWTLQSFDVTAHKNSNFRVRFGKSIGAGGAYTSGGWSVDDVRVFDPTVVGITTCSFTVSVIGSLTTWYADNDGDGFGDPGNSLVACAQPAGHVLDNTDCLDDVFGANIGSACDDGDPTTVNDLVTELCVCAGIPGGVSVLVRVLLEGPYDPGTGLMRDDLRAQGLLPLDEPYSALGYAYVGGGDGTTTGNVLDGGVMGPSFAKVDWVIVELRDPSDPTVVVASRAGLLQRDGIITNGDGTVLFFDDVPPGDYHIAVRHRNHLGAMTATAFALGFTAGTTKDLTNGSLAMFGTNALRSLGGAFPAQALWAGDVTFNHVVKYTGAGNDRDPILVRVGSITPNNAVSGYHREDVNMNGQVKYTGSGNDRDPILVNVGSTTPNNIRQAQLP